MFRSGHMVDIFRTVVLVILVFLVSLLLVATIFGIILTTGLFYAFWYYFKKSKVLQRQLADSNIKSDTPMPPQDTIPSPSSTDA